MDAINQLASEQLTPELLAELQALRAENRKLKGVKADGLSVRVSQKGAVSVYGLGRFPVTLYRSQWSKLISGIPAIKQFIADNASQLTEKQ